MLYGKDNLANNTTILFLIFFGITFTINNFLFHPYRIKSLFEQKYSINKIKSDENILVDHDTFSFLENIHLSLLRNGFIKGDQIIGVSKLSSVIFLMDGTSPGGAYWSGDVFSLTQLENLKHIGTKLKDPIIMYRGTNAFNASENKFIQQLSNVNINFEQDYFLIDSIMNMPSQNSHSINLFIFKKR